MGRSLPDILTPQEQDQLLNVFNLRYITPHRNKTMVRVLLDAGLRLSEMTNLKWRDINLMTGQLKVVQGKEQRQVLMW